MQNKRLIEQRQQKVSKFWFIILTIGVGLFFLYNGYVTAKGVWFISDLFKLVGFGLIALFIINEVNAWYIHRR